MQLSWGNKVSSLFRDRVVTISMNLGITDPGWLMACIAFESGETFRPDIRNALGSGAVGLIQFMRHTAFLLGTSIDALAHMTAEEQLTYVNKYLTPNRGRYTNLGDVYMTILDPVAVGQSDAYILFRKSDPNHPKQYIENRGLDFNHDGTITRGEAYHPVVLKWNKGMMEGNMYTI